MPPQSRATGVERQKGALMSQRDEVLVDTDWVASHLDDPAFRLIEVDEDTTAYAGGHIRNAIAWHWKDDLHDGLRREFLDQDALRGAPGPLRRRPRHDRRALRRQQQLVRHLRLLGAALQGLRPRAAGGRRPQEVGARGARAGDGGPDAGRRRPGAARPGARGAARLPRRRAGPPGRHRQHVRRRPQPRRVLGRDAGPAAPAAGAGPGARPHPGRGQRAVGQRGPRRRLLQERRGADGPLRRTSA